MPKKPRLEEKDKVAVALLKDGLKYADIQKELINTFGSGISNTDLGAYRRQLEQESKPQKNTKNNTGNIADIKLWIKQHTVIPYYYGGFFPSVHCMLCLCALDMDHFIPHVEKHLQGIVIPKQAVFFKLNQWLENHITFRWDQITTKTNVQSISINMCNGIVNLSTSKKQTALNPTKHTHKYYYCDICNEEINDHDVIAHAIDHQ